MVQARQRRNAARSDHQLGAIAHLPQGTLRSYTVAALPILNHFLQRLDLEAILQSHVPSEDRRRKVSEPRGLLILVKNLLLAREPLYGLREWAARYDPSALGLTPEQGRTLNDDRLGRDLTVLFHANRPALLLNLIHHVMREFALNLDELHNDSTTISFSGAYSDAATEKSRRGQIGRASCRERV